MPRLTKALGFAAIPLFGFLTPLFVLPAITAHSGASGWVAVAIGQSIGGTVAALIELGWAWNGPMRVARARAPRRRYYMALAFKTRLVMLVPTATVATVIAFLASDAFPIESALTALASCFAGLSMSWFFFGTGRPWRAVLLDSLPRLIGAGASTALLVAGSPLWTYPVVALLLPSCIALTLSLIVTRVTCRDLRRAGWRQLRLTIRAQASIAIARTTSALYMQLPVTLFSMVSTVSATAVFAAGDRVARMVLAAMSPIPNAVQQWVGSPATQRAREGRARRAMVAVAALGVLAGIAVAIFLPLASHLIFNGTSDVPPAGAAVLGLLVAVVSTSRGTGGIGLVVRGHPVSVLHSALAGAVVGLPAVLAFGAAFGPIGGFLGITLAEVAVLGVQLAALRRRRPLTS